MIEVPLYKRDVIRSSKINEDKRLRDARGLWRSEYLGSKSTYGSKVVRPSEIHLSLLRTST